jgi:RNA polymerase sigma-70 factor (ECF subfamily)
MRARLARVFGLTCPGPPRQSHIGTVIAAQRRPENNRKISEHFSFSSSLSLQGRRGLAGQAILGDTVLKSAIAMEDAAPTVEMLVADHAGMVFRIAYSILRNHHDAEDAAQECFLRVWKQKDRLSEVSNSKTWLARIAWTTALDKRRSSPAMVSLSDEQSGAELAQSIPDLAVAADQQLASAQMQQILERLIAGLPEDLRNTLELSTIQELNSAEIAEVMKIPEGSVRTRLFRARKQLKEKLTVLLEGRKHG